MDEPRNDNGLPEAVLPLLTAAGWVPGRSVDTAPFKAAYDAEQISWTQEVDTFLREFGDLIIEYKTRFSANDVLEFCAQRAAQGIGHDGVKEFEELVGRITLCPLGHYQFGTCMLFMAPKGEIFGGTDEVITFVGKTGKLAIGNILTQAELKVIGRFPAFKESFPDTKNPPSATGTNGTGSVKRATDEIHERQNYQDFVAMITALLEPRGFKPVLQKKSVSWALSQAGHAKRSNVIFKLVDRGPMAVQFGARKKWLEGHSHPEDIIGDKTFTIRGVEFVGQAVPNDQIGQKAILELLSKILF